MDPREGRGCCLLTSPSLGYNVTGLVAGAALGLGDRVMGLLWATANIKLVRLTLCVCVFLWGWGTQTLGGSPSQSRAGKVVKSDAVKKVYKLYCSTYTHTPVDREEHLATG